MTRCLGILTRSRNRTTSARLSTTGNVLGILGAGITAFTDHGFCSVTVYRKRSAATATTMDAGANGFSVVK